MKRSYACHSPVHLTARRRFLGDLVAGAGVSALSGALAGQLDLSLLARPTMAQNLAAQQKRMLVIWLGGGLSQLESWDPKPGTSTGGPFNAIPTSVPGTHICELLPKTAKQMHHISLIRSMNTRNDAHDHGKYLMQHLHREERGREHPHLGAVCSKALDAGKRVLPGFIRVTNRPERSGQDAAYLGARYASVGLQEGQALDNIALPEGLDAKAFRRRALFRRNANSQFGSKLRTADTDAYAYSFEQAEQLMTRRDIFDANREPESLKDRYGRHEFGRHCLLARRLLEHGVSYVQLSHVNYDTHNENFNFHIEKLAEFDGSFAALIDDMAQRGLLEHTLVCVMSEFGRTPKINRFYGRDHWSTAWTVALAGCGIHHGAIVGKTNETGTAVVDREVHQFHLFHTFLHALGVDSSENFIVDGKPIPIADPAHGPIDELLA